MRVGQSFRRMERLKNDSEYRNKREEMRKKWVKKNRERLNKKAGERLKVLTLWKNKRCILCDKIMVHTARGQYCRECFYSNPKLRFGGKNETKNRI